MNRTEAVIIDLTSSSDYKGTVGHQNESSSPSTRPHYYENSMIKLQVPQNDSAAPQDLFGEMEPYLNLQNKSNQSAHYLQSKLMFRYPTSIYYNIPYIFNY
ncbi:hypothetical protein FBU30_003610 [Linnemannia zychae]|nr:hypothetical protein FBU30_003610 [Linnemannia zychae]